MEKILLMILRAVLKAVTPQIRGIVVEFIAKLEEMASKTPNEWDDVFVGVLKALLAVEDS